MAWQALCWRWLIQASLGSLILYGGAHLLLAWRRQPAQKLRLIELALLGSLAAPCLSFFPGAPSWTIAGIDFGWSDGNVADAERALAPAKREPEDIESGDVAPSASFGAAGAPAAYSSLAWRRPRALQQAILGAYGLTAFLFFARWLSGVCRLLKLARTARPAPAEAHKLLAELAGSSAARIQLLASPCLDAPIVFGWRKPVIVLPERLCRGADIAALRYCLAHEWSHVERGDARLWYLAALAQFAFFFQPLFWQLRRQVRLCQDYLADARAAAEGAAVEDYAEYLLAVVRGRLTAPPSPAMGFGDRRSNLYRRVLMLVESREPLERRCCTPWNCVFASATLALALGASSLRLDANENRRSLSQPQLIATRAAAEIDSAPNNSAPPAEASLGEPQSLSLAGRVIEHDTGKAIEGATIVVRRRELGPGGNRVLQESLHQADAEGVFSFAISSEQLANRWLYVEFDIEHPGFASQNGIGCAIDALRDNKRLEAQPHFEEFALRRGQEVTGILETYAGGPAAGVDVLAYSQGDAKPWEHGAFARTKTDSQGRFRITLASPGDGVLYLQPAELPPAMYAVRRRRGDLGRIRLPSPSRIAVNQRRLDRANVSIVDRLAAAEPSSAPLE